MSIRTSCSSFAKIDIDIAIIDERQTTCKEHGTMINVTFLLSSSVMVIRVVSIPRCIPLLSGLILMIVRVKFSFGSKAIRSSVIGPVKQASGADAGIVTVSGIPDGL